ncbi:MAG: helix-turn-helix domain-containing protein [Bacteroidetes bacterium]|nr:helix-turn-helix domain-containing protein [Bacteroidota bacterium]
MKTKEKLDIKVIRSQKQYNLYLKEIERRMEVDPLPQSETGRELEILTVLVEDYERKHGWEIPQTNDPVDVIQKRMEDLNLRQADLAKVIGDKTVVSRILNRSRKLTYSMVLPLSKLLRVPPEFLLEKNAA